MRVLHETSSGDAHSLALVLVIQLLGSVEHGPALVEVLAKPAQPAWFTERPLGAINVGSLVLLEVARTAVRAVHGRPDVYITAYAASALLLLSDSCRDCHVHTADRLVAALSLVQRKLDKESDAALRTDLEALQHVLADVIVRVYRSDRSSNVHVLYGLLQRIPVIETLDRFVPRHPLPAVVRAASSMLAQREAELSGCSVDEYVGVLRHNSRDLHVGKVRVCSLVRACAPPL